MSGVFLDTVGLLAVWNTSDQWHRAATSALQTITQAHRPVLTSQFVLLECGNAAARHPFRLDVDDLRAKLEGTAGLIFPTYDDWTQAWAGYRTRAAGGAGIVDQISIVVMRRLGLIDVFSNDQHFRAAGFNTLF